jgi:hypothetical protein
MLINNLQGLRERQKWRFYGQFRIENAWEAGLALPEIRAKLSLPNHERTICPIGSAPQLSNLLIPKNV